MPSGTLKVSAGLAMPACSVYGELLSEDLLQTSGNLISGMERVPRIRVKRGNVAANTPSKDDTYLGVLPGSPKSLTRLYAAYISPPPPEP